MAKGYGHFNLRLGDHATASNNFFLAVPDTADGTIRLVQGTPASETRNVWTVNSSGVITLATQGIIKGTATNDSAAAGYVGEYTEGIAALTSCNSSSGQYKDIASVSLTAGDWDVTGLAQFVLNAGSTVSYFGLGISSTSGNSGTGLVEGSNFLNFQQTGSATTFPCICVPSYRVSISGTTSYYLKVFTNWSVAYPNAEGRISARRVR